MGSCAFSRSLAAGVVIRIVPSSANARREPPTLVVPAPVLYSSCTCARECSCSFAQSQNGRGLIAIPRLTEGEIDPLVLRVFGMQNKIIEAGIGARIDFRDAAERFSDQHSIPNQAKIAAALAHQNIAARKKRDAEGTLQSLGHHGHFDLVLLSGIENERAVSQVSAGKIDHIGLPVEQRAAPVTAPTKAMERRFLIDTLYAGRGN